MRRWLSVTLLAALTLAFGCSEGGAGSATTGTAGSGGQTTSGQGGSSTTSTGVGAGAPGQVVINEIAAKGADWIEIANSGDEAFDLGDHGLCGDVDPTKGSECDLSSIVRFPKGTTLPAGGYLLIVGDQDAAAGVGPHVTCLPSGGPTTCFYASWKVSSSNGETVHLVDAEDTPLDEVPYPPDAVPEGQTWGRVPDRSGGFAANDPTPGAANQAH